MVRTITIRQAESSEFITVADIIRHSFHDVAARFRLTPENCPKHPSNCTPEWVKSDMERGVTFFLLCEGETPVGTVALEQPRTELCYLERLSILPTHRKMGFGEALVRHIFQEAEKRNAREISIAIIAEQTELRHWYEKLGFHVTARKHFDHLPFEVMFMRYILREE